MNQRFMPEGGRLDARVANMTGAGRAAAKELILSGQASVNGVVNLKPSSTVKAGDIVTLAAAPRKYAGRGGLKLEAALDAFGISVAGETCLDVGASTGGFTDCLLTRGAAFVYAVDTGTGQLIERLRQDGRVACMERTNVNSLGPADFPAQPRFACVDVSFVSVTKIMASVYGILRESWQAVVLVKPQFEAGRACVGKNGVVKDKRAHRLALAAVYDASAALGAPPLGVIRSPLAGGSGNIEYLLHIRPGDRGLDKPTFARACEEAVFS